MKHLRKIVNSGMQKHIQTRHPSFSSLPLLTLLAVVKMDTGILCNNFSLSLFLVSYAFAAACLLAARRRQYEKVFITQLPTTTTIVFL